MVQVVCPNCNANITYSIGATAIECKYCGHTEPLFDTSNANWPVEFPLTQDILDEAARGWGIERVNLACSSCNAEFTVAKGQLTSRCSFCGRNTVAVHEHSERTLRPRFVLPFAVREDEVKPAIRKWLRRNAWLYPRDLKKKAILEQSVQLYLPFWTFDISTEYRHNDKDEKNRELTADDLVVSGTEHVPPYVVGLMEDYDLGKMVDYDPKLLAGYQAQAYEVGLRQAMRDARAIVDTKILRKRGRIARIRQLSSDVKKFEIGQWRYVLLPVYLSAYNYDGKVYQIVVNGQTGKVAGIRPVVIKRYERRRTIAILAMMLSPVGYLGLFGVLFTNASPETLLALCGLYLMFFLGGMLFPIAIWVIAFFIGFTYHDHIMREVEEAGKFNL